MHRPPRPPRLLRTSCAASKEMGVKLRGSHVRPSHGGGDGGGGDGGGEGGEGGGRGNKKGSAAPLQLKPSFNCVGSTAACTHFSVTGVGGGDCMGTCEQTLRTAARSLRGWLNSTTTPRSRATCHIRRGHSHMRSKATCRETRPPAILGVRPPAILGVRPPVGS